MITSGDRTLPQRYTCLNLAPGLPTSPWPQASAHEEEGCSQERHSTGPLQSGREQEHPPSSEACSGEDPLEPGETAC